MQKTHNAERNLRIIVCTVAVILIVALVGFAVGAALGGGVGAMGEKEEILAKIAEAKLAKPGDYTYVESYIADFGIGGYDAGKMRAVEGYFMSWYDGERREPHEHAIECAELYMKNCYDTAEGRTNITDMLIKCYVISSGDKYAAYRTADEYVDYSEDLKGKFVGIGVSVLQEYQPNSYLIKSVLVVKVMDNSGALAAGIKPGDYIVSVNGKNIDEMSDLEFANAARGEVGSTIDIGVLRDGEKMNFTVTRSKITEKTVEYEMLDNKIGYIELSGFKGTVTDDENKDAATAYQMDEALSYMYTMSAKGIIIDVRNNPGGLLTSVVEVISLFVPEGTRITSYYSGDLTLGSEYASGRDNAIDIPIVVLCNENTASAGELFTSAMRDYNEVGLLDATIVGGEKTRGKGVMQSTIPLPNQMFSDGSTLTLTIAHYTSPDGENYQDKGVIPEVKITDEDTGTVWLDKALETIEDMISGIDHGGTNNPGNVA